MRTPLSPQVLGLLRLGRRSGALTLGLRATLRAAAHSRVALAILAYDASARTQAAVRARVRTVQVDMSMEALGQALGTAPVAVVGVRAGPLASHLLSLLPPEPSS